MKFQEVLGRLKEWSVRKLKGKFGKRLVILLSILVLCFLFRSSILRGVGGFLIREDVLEQSDAIFSLGGNVYDRVSHSVHLYNEGFAPRVIATGENVAMNLEILKIDLNDALLGKQHAIDLGLPAEKFYALEKGTSTMEEAEAIIQYCKENELKKVIVVSDLFHLRRINWTFRSMFEEVGVELILSGCPNSKYKVETWWNYEEGLLMVNNEYVKLMYYMIKY